jgi:hypothetical protein
MSAVAPAVKSVSDSPAKNAVTDPTNQTILQDDVDRKLKFYAVIQAFRAGRLPDNKQIDETLEYVKKTSPIDIAKLSPDGKRLIDDARAIIETVCPILTSYLHRVSCFSQGETHRPGEEPRRAVPELCRSYLWY